MASPGSRRALSLAVAGCLAFLSACGTPDPLQAQIERHAIEYEKHKHYAKYDEDWRRRVERIGNANYPEALRGGQLSGDLRLTVEIRPDGSVQAVRLLRSSGHESLDRAALRIVELASPFAPFPPEIRKDTGLYVITRTWYLGQQVRTTP